MTSFRQLTTIFTFDDRKEHVFVHWCVDNEILQSHEIEDIFVYSSTLSFSELVIDYAAVYTCQLPNHSHSHTRLARVHGLKTFRIHPNQ